MMRASYRAICAVLTAFMVSRSVADSMVNFTMTVDGQNTCGIDYYEWEGYSYILPTEDCITLRGMHADDSLTGSYTYFWTGSDVPEGTFIYGPWYGDCVTVWKPSDYTQAFTIGNQDIYDILGTAIEANHTTEGVMPCQGGSGGTSVIVQWEIGRREAGFNPCDGSCDEPFGNYA